MSKDLKQPFELVETWSLIQLPKHHASCKALLLRSPWGTGKYSRHRTCQRPPPLRGSHWRPAG